MQKFCRIVYRNLSEGLALAGAHTFATAFAQRTRERDLNFYQLKLTNCNSPDQKLNNEKNCRDWKKKGDLCMYIYVVGYKNRTNIPTRNVRNAKTLGQYIFWIRLATTSYFPIFHLRLNIIQVLPNILSSNTGPYIKISAFMAAYHSTSANARRTGYRYSGIVLLTFAILNFIMSDW